MNQPGDIDNPSDETKVDDPFVQVDAGKLGEGRDLFYCSNCGVVGVSGSKNPLCLGLCSKETFRPKSELLQKAIQISEKIRKNTALTHIKTKNFSQEEAMTYMTEVLLFPEKEAEDIWRLHSLTIDIRNACEKIPDMPFDPD